MPQIIVVTVQTRGCDRVSHLLPVVKGEGVNLWVMACVWQRSQEAEGSRISSFPSRWFNIQLFISTTSFLPPSDRRVELSGFFWIQGHVWVESLFGSLSEGHKGSIAHLRTCAPTFTGQSSETCCGYITSCEGYSSKEFPLWFTHTLQKALQAVDSIMKWKNTRYTSYSRCCFSDYQQRDYVTRILPYSWIKQ